MWNRMMIAAMLFAAAGATGQAQETAAAAQTTPAQPADLEAVKVQVVISRYKGDTKVSSLPYELGVVVHAGRTNLRMGTDVPVISTVFSSTAKGGVANVPTTSYNYRRVGTDIDCSAERAPGNYYKLSMTVSDSSVQLETGDRAKPLAQNAPMFRSFNSTFSALLRDKQTAQYTSATDPVTGEVTKIDVTLNVLK